MELQYQPGGGTLTQSPGRDMVAGTERFRDSALPDIANPEAECESDEADVG